MTASSATSGASHPPCAKTEQPQPEFDDQTLERYAQLVIQVGVNLQHGQELAIIAPLDASPLVHALGRAAYTAGAKLVDPWYFDPALQRIRAESAELGSLSYVPEWYGARMLALGEARGARISVFPFSPPGNLDGIAAERLGHDLLPRTREQLAVTHAKLTNWCVIPWPSASWARRSHPDHGDALAALAAELIYVLRLDTADPVEAWHKHFESLASICDKLNAAKLHKLHFDGPGTDLSVGLLPGSRFVSVADWETVDGIRFANNLPSEEVLTTPDPIHTHGVVTATKPLYINGARVEGLRLEFVAGAVVNVHADHGADLVRALVDRDPGARRLGEVALVSGDGRVASTRRTFFDTLLDENAATHLALGNAYSAPITESDIEKINRSSIHLDFMIGSPELTITGAGSSGQVALIARDEWQI